MYCNLTIVYTQGGEGKPLRGCSEVWETELVQDYSKLLQDFYAIVWKDSEGKKMR